MKSIAVIGLDRFGITLATTLTQLGHQVLCIDKNETTIQAVADIVTNAVCANPTSEAALRAAGLKSFDATVICLSDSMENSLLTVLAVKEIGINAITVRAISDDHKKILEKLGISDIIYPEYDMATKLAYRINKSKIREYLEFSNDYSIIEVAVPEKWVGKTLRNLDVRNTYGINVIAISHPSSHSVDISINPNNPLSKDDALVLLGTDDIIQKFAKSID
ncbi:MAG: NAD-binding protein [Eubacteriales bacterium]